jgi:hypothetical protein
MNTFLMKESIMPENNPLKSIEIAISLSPHDWSSHHRLAWIYGIACGWDDESLSALAKKYRWTSETIARLRSLRSKYQSMSDAIPPNSGRDSLEF